MLSIKNISLSAGDFCIKNLSLEIADGEYHALLGPSGSGKTVLLNTIAGFIKPENGSIFFMDKDISDLAPEKRKISYLFQDLALFPHLNVTNNVAYSLRAKGVKKATIAKLVDEYLDFAQISDLKNRTIEKLSGGEKQRVALARILVTGNPLLLLDEPFSAIDTQLKTGLKKLLRKISDNGITVIHVTHNIEEVLGLADNISIVENGSIIQSGKFYDVLNQPKNKFIAGFSGVKNYFNEISVNNENKSNIIKLTDNVNIEFSNTLPSNTSAIIIDSNNIIISESKIVSSARNNYNGVIVSIIKVFNGYSVETDIGIKIWANITDNSFHELKLREGKEIWISFKASSIKIIEG